MSNSQLPILMFLLGCGLLTAILLRRSSRYFGRSARRRQREGPIDAQPRPTGPWSGAHHDASALIERQKVELYDVARDATGELNSKILLLEELLAQSQRQINRLESLLADLNQRDQAAQ